jgi:hypothetical protein
MSGLELYVSAYNDGAIWKYNDDFSSPSQVYAAPDGHSRVGGVAVFPEGRYLFTTGTGKTIYVMNPDHTLNNTIPQPGGLALDGDLWNFNGQLAGYTQITEAFIYVSRTSSTDVTVVDLTTNAVIVKYILMMMINVDTILVL